MDKVGTCAVLELGLILVLLLAMSLTVLNQSYYLYSSSLPAKLEIKGDIHKD